MKVSSVAPSGSGAAAQSSTEPSRRARRLFETHPMIRQAGDDGAQLSPAASPWRSGAQRSATRSICGWSPSCVRPQRPDAGEGRVEQFEAPVAAEHRDAFLQRVEGLALHADQRR